MLRIIAKRAVIQVRICTKDGGKMHIMRDTYAKMKKKCTERCENI